MHPVNAHLKPYSCIDFEATGKASRKVQLVIVADLGAAEALGLFQALAFLLALGEVVVG